MISESVHKVASGSVSIEKRVEGFYSRIENDPLHAFLFISEKSSLLNSFQINRSIKTGALTGIVFAVKDNICVQGMPCTAASKILENFISPYDATVVKKIRAEGGIVIGKTNLDEFAMGSSTEYSAYGPTLNPLDTSRVPGGSGGGSAVAVASGYADIALGSDTGGSVRLPAAFTGTVGFKPGYGVLSRVGLIAYASSLDQIGIHAGNVDDVLYVLPILAGKDSMDLTSMGLKSSMPEKNEIGKVVLGVPDIINDPAFHFETRKEFLAVLDRLKLSGWNILPIPLNDWNNYLKTYYIIACAEAASNLARYDGVRYGKSEPMGNTFYDWISVTRSANFGTEVKRRIVLGNFVLGEKYRKKYYLKAMKYRQKLIDELNEIFKKIDAIITPTSLYYPFKFGEKMHNPTDMLRADMFTVLANLSYIPAISIPYFHTAGYFPLGIQLMGPRHSDYRILRMAKYIQEYLND